MIVIRSLREASGGYLLADPALEVNELEAGGGPGRWAGGAAAPLGLAGAVEPGELSAVLRGRPPGSTLRERPRERTAALDLIIAAPKPVSVLFASPDDARARTVLRAHRRAVEATVAYLERRAAVVRRSIRGEVHCLGADGLLAAEFTHGLSRSGDPHLHSHLLVANLARDSSGRFGALDRRPLLAHAQAADALYRAQLRLELRERLGLRWQDGPGGRERIEGVSDALALALSGRAAEQRAGRRRPPAKEWAPSRAALVERWAERARLAPTLDDAPRRSSPAGQLDEHRFASMLTGRGHPARDLVRAWAESARGGLEAGVAERALLRLSQPIGHGVEEDLLAPRSLLPSARALRLLGARPTERGPLEAWWRRAGELERPLSLDRLTGSSRSRTVDRGR